MQPLYALWVNSWVETENVSRKMKLKLCPVEASVGAPPNCYELPLCSLCGAQVSEDYCFCCCADVSVVQVLVTWCVGISCPL